MKKPKLLLLSSLLLLSACGETSLSSSILSQSSETTISSMPSVSSSSSLSSESSSLTATSSSSSSSSSESSLVSSSSLESGPLTIASITGLTLPVYTYKNGTYTFSLDATNKTGVVLSGELNGNIVVDPGTLTDNQYMEIDLNGVNITSSSAAPIYYKSAESKIVVKPQKGTTNNLTYSGTSTKLAAILSENNIEIGGKGTLNLASGGHGIKGDDITFSSATAITISSTGNDGIHGHTFNATAFTGTLTMGTIASQAFDINNVDTTALTYGGSVTFLPATSTEKAVITIASCANIFQIDNSFIVTPGVSIVATAVTGLLIENLNPSSIELTVSGTFTANGSPIISQTIAGAK